MANRTPGVAVKTRPWRRLPRRAFRWALLAAFVLHVPLLPTRLGGLLERLFSSRFDDYDDADAGALIPIDLDLLQGEPSAESAAPPEPTPPNQAAEAPKPPGGDGFAAADAGAPVDAGAPKDAGADAEALDAGASDAGKPKKPSAPSDAGPPPDAGPPEPQPLRDPVAAAGGAGKIAARVPNVQVLISGRVLRKFEVGNTLSRILSMIPEWKQFLDGTPVDPIRDLNHLLITAPRFRGDSSKMVVVMEWNLPEAKIRDAVDIVVQRANGAWIEDAPVPAAQAKVLAGERIFALVPGKKILVVLPVEAKDQLAGLKQTKGFKSSSVGVVLSMVTPARPFRGVFPLPSTLKWMRLAVTPTADGGADVTIEAGDKSADEAAKHAPEITDAFEKVRKIDLGVATVDVIEHTEFKAEGDVIKANAHVTKRQLTLITGFAEQRMRDLAEQRAAHKGKAPSPPAFGSAEPDDPPAAPTVTTTAPNTIPRPDDVAPAPTGTVER